MYPVVTDKEAYHLPLHEYSEKLESALPTFDRSLDAYFDTRFASIIEEWELVTENNLHEFERRLAKVTGEIGTLCANKTVIEKRIGALDKLISSLEETK